MLQLPFSYYYIKEQKRFVGWIDGRKNGIQVYPEWNEFFLNKEKE